MHSKRSRRSFSLDATEVEGGRLLNWTQYSGVISMHRSLISVALISFAVCSDVNAQPSLEICRNLTAGGLFDDAFVQTDASSFQTTNDLVCSATSSTYSKAKAISADTGVDIVEIVSGSFGLEVDESNYSEARSQFCSKSFAQAMADHALASRIRTASSVLARSFSQCIDTVANADGFFGYIKPSRNRDSFAIIMDKRDQDDQSYKITGITTSPGTATCDGNAHEATRARPYPFGNNSLNGRSTILCKPDDPTQSFLVAVNTDAGDIRGRNNDPIEIAGQAETLADTRDRLAVIERSLVPSGAVIFIEDRNCPPGWRADPKLKGRYVVGLQDGGTVGESVGQALSDKENRATGKHTHRVTYNRGRVNRTKGGNADHKATDDELPHAVTTEAAGTVDGTNAPYVQYLGCMKE